MGQILTKDRIVVPGQVIAEGMDYLPANGTVREGEKIVSTYNGILKVDGRVINVIPLSSPYVPKEGDSVIGKVVDITFGGWQVDIGSAYPANLSLKDATSEFIERGADLTRFYNFDDIIFVQITKVVRSKIVDLTMRGPGYRKLGTGRIITINSAKVPRVIGKQGSMISLIKEKTNTNINVGQNGKVWIKGEKIEDELKAEEAIRKIEEEGHIEGLTQKIEKFLG